MENGERALVTILADDPAVHQSLKALLEAAGYRAGDASEPSVSTVTVAVESGGVVPLAELEQRAIEHALQVTGGRVAKAARLLGIGRATLYRRLAARPAMVPGAGPNSTPPEPHAGSIH